jgi:thiol-disulfide isomerase/thioredoxin
MNHSMNTAWQWAIFAAAGLFLTTNSSAQAVKAPPPSTAATVVAQPRLSGVTMDKKPFDLAQTKGKVVLVMFWSTDCAVCRDKMPELRDNVQGWADKPFELVMVNIDKRMEDVASYNAILNQSVPAKLRFTRLWSGDAAFKDNLNAAQTPKSQLPKAFLFDKTGKLVSQTNGRIPAAWWDTIAELL